MSALYILFVFYVGCNTDKTKQKGTKTNSVDFFTIELPEVIKDTKPVKLSEIASKIEYIPFHLDNCTNRMGIDSFVKSDYI